MVFHVSYHALCVFLISYHISYTWYVFFLVSYIYRICETIGEKHMMRGMTREIPYRMILMYVFSYRIAWCVIWYVDWVLNQLDLTVSSGRRITWYSWYIISYHVVRDIVWGLGAWNQLVLTISRDIHDISYHIYDIIYTYIYISVGKIDQ